MRQIYFLFFCILTLLNSCKEPSREIEDPSLKIEAMISQLQSASEDGKVIKSITSIENDEQNGWLVTFSDNTELQLINRNVNGGNIVTPYVKKDIEGYWNVSYDKGVVFERLQQESGGYIFALGEDSISLDIIVNDEGFYVYQLYRDAELKSANETIVTPYVRSQSNILFSILQDDLASTVVFTTVDNHIFTFNMEKTGVGNVVMLATELFLGTNSISAFEFQVYPSDLSFEYNIERGTGLITLDKISENLTTSFPENYELIKVEPSVNTEGVEKKGQYTAYIKDLGISSNYKESIKLSLSLKDEKGNSIRIFSNAIKISSGLNGNAFTSFGFHSNLNPTKVLDDIDLNIINDTILVCIPYLIDFSNLVASFVTNGEKIYVDNVEQVSDVTANDFSSPVIYKIVSSQGIEQSFVVKIINTELPVVHIETPENVEITSKDIWTEGSTISIHLPDGSIDYVGNMSIRGRGNSTWGYPKKPYAIKLDKKSKVLGMPKHKRWVLLANWMDRTLLRNSVAFEIARATDQEWVSRGKHVEVVLNEKHIGNYYLCEQIKIDENRVNIKEMTSEDIDSESITGGYLLEFDTNFDEVNKFYSKIFNLPVMLKDPDEEVLQTQQLEYITTYVNTIEELLSSENYLKVRDYLDINSFIDWWFIHELTLNGEPLHPKSSYMYKDRNAKLKAGPVWDFDWGTFRPLGGYCVKNAIWYSLLFKDPVFVQTVKVRWKNFKGSFENIIPFIDKQASLIKKSSDVNIKMWPIDYLLVNGDESLSFDEAVERMKNAYRERLDWLDAAINAL